MARTSGPYRAVSNPNVNASNSSNTGNNNGFISQSGSLGSISNPPTDALIVSATANAAAANTVTLTNASHGQATTYTINDAGTNASFVTSSAGSLMTTSVTLNTAAVTGAFAAPAQLIAAPGAGKTIIVQEATVYTASTSNTAYATGTSPVIQYDSTVHGAGTAATSALATGDLTAASSQIKSVTSPTGALTGITNKGVFFSNATGAYTAGTGTNVVITLTYMVVTATV